MNLRISEKKFVCVDYPGIVQNHDAMLQTLGGAAKVTATYCDPAKRLELCFRQKDAGCRPLFGNRQTCKGLLLRVRRCRRRDISDNSVDMQQRTDNVCSMQSASERSQSTSLSSNMYQYSADVIGIVETVYRFQTLSDFQYLLADPEPGGTFKAIHDQVYLTDLQSRLWLNEQTPLCLLPPQFSRFDHPIMYCYREPPTHRSEHVNTLPKLDPNVIGISRSRRPHHTRFMSYYDEAVPTEPNAAAVHILQKKRVSPAAVDEIKKMFELKPVWSRSALAAHLTPSLMAHILSAALPALAYYFVSQPWRSTWMRFGYDPRTDPQAKIYQTLDVRIPRNIPDESNAVPKRNSYRAPHVRAKSCAKPPVIQLSTFDTTQTDRKEVPDSVAISQDPTYRFRPGIVPAYRQMFYQLCYVDEPEVQRLVHENDGQETECLEKDGWCRPETIDKCRVLVTAHIASSTLQASSVTDASSVRRVHALTEDGESSELSDDDDIDRFSCDVEQQNDDDDDVAVADFS